MFNLSAAQMRFSLLDDLTTLGIQPRYNIAPTELAPLVVRNSPNRLVVRKWGFVPSWAKDKPGARALINARAETVAEAKSFAKWFRTSRVVVPASHWFEWQKTDSGKVPYCFHRPDWRMIGLAGLLTDPDGPEPGFVICTTPPNDLAAAVHDRMPAVLLEEDEDGWLDPAEHDPKRLLPLLRPYPNELTASHIVSRAVNRSGIDDPKLIEPA